MTCKHLMNGIEDCVFCQRDHLQQEVNGLLVENANLRGVRDQLLVERDAIKRTREQEREYADVCYENERLRAALLGLSVAAQRISEEAALALARGDVPQSASHAAEHSMK